MALDLREWLEADGLGGYAMGTASGIRTRRYHALLVAATRPPARRMALVGDLEVFAETPGGRHALSSHRYAGGVLHPDGASRVASFSPEPWPTWRFALPDGTAIRQELLVQPGRPRVLVRWTQDGGRGPATLSVRPLLSGRDHHALHHENPAFRFAARTRGAAVRWSPYPGVPAVDALSNGAYRHGPDWYRSFLYAEEAARGLDAIEDLASPGEFTFELGRAPAVLALSAGPDASDGDLPEEGDPLAVARELAAAEEARRAGFSSTLRRAAEAYLVRRDGGRTVIAGYPWFTDWGRDTFVALRGICLARGRVDEALDVARTWAAALSEGMLPNRFPETGDPPEYASVDSALWFAVAAGDLLGQAGTPRPDRRHLGEAVLAVVARYAEGTRAGIRRDVDGLLACGAPGTRLTWMDAAVRGSPVTSRVGKPVEVEALWVNALAVAARLDPRREGALAQARAAFVDRFWDPTRACLHDVVDPDHRPGTVDPSFRPNQILAAGGLPLPLLDPERARRVVDAVEERLWTPAGLRSLEPADPRYRGRYEGDPAQRDAAYHQGTVWPWLAGPFVEAWLRSRGGTAAAAREARRRFLEPLRATAGALGMGHLAELADGDPPHAPRGCPFQAWSVGAALQIEAALVAAEAFPA